VLRSAARSALRRVRRPTTRAWVFANRANRVTRYGLDLVLWSRLLASRRGPVPLEVPPALRRRKGVAHAAPRLHVSGPPAQVQHWDEGFEAVYANLFLNLKRPDWLSPVRYAHPAPAFPGIYLWDSAFIAQVWKPWDRAVAHEVNEAVLLQRDGDRLQHVAADVATSVFTQPPLVAWSAQRMFEEEAARPERARDFFEPLVGYNGWLYRERCFQSGPMAGLFFWEHPYESGVENAPRFSSRDESELADTRRMAAPDLSAYVLLQNEALAGMAELLGETRLRERFAGQAERLRELMNEHLWDERDGLYYDRDVDSGALVRSKTIASLLPLWAGVPSQERAERLLEHVLDEAAFNTLLPLPSVARDDADFSKDMWRGPVWINTAYGVLLGLQRYGFHDAASDLAYRLVDGVYQTYARCRRLFEFYDPERYDTEELHRKLGNRWKKFTLGDKPRPEFVGWTGLVNTLVVEYLVGYRCERGRATLTPRFPRAAEGLGFALRLPAENVAIEVDVLEERRARVVVRQGGQNEGTRRATIGFGETLDLGAPKRSASSHAPQ
jgi:hypothetical protein